MVRSEWVGCVPVKIYLRNRWQSWVWPVNHSFVNLCSRYDFLVGFWHHSSLLLLSVVSLVDYFILMGSNPSVFVSQFKIHGVLLNLKITNISDFFLLVFCLSFIRSVSKSCLSLCNPMDCSLPSSSVSGISQARILEWVAVSFSRGSIFPDQGSNPRLLRWHVDSLPLSLYGSPLYFYLSHFRLSKTDPFVWRLFFSI